MDRYADKSWQVGSNGAGKKHWFVWRHGASTNTTYEGMITAKDKRGNIRRFANEASAIALATLLASTAAHAYTVTFSDTLLPDTGIFNNCLGVKSCATSIGTFDLYGTSAFYPSGFNVKDVALAPQPTGVYFEATDDVVLHTTTEQTSIEFNWGSWDYYPVTDQSGTNWFQAGQTVISAEAIAALFPYHGGLGRNVSIVVSGLPAFDVATWSNFPITGFEVGAVGIPGQAVPTPEPSTWLMMLLGFAGLGYAALDKRRRLARVET